MSSALVAALARIQYPGAVQPASLDWLFDDEGAADLLTFVSGLTEDNFVSDTDLATFSVLEANGKALSGRDLDRALADLMISEGDMSADELRAENARLKAVIAAEQVYLDKSTAQRDRLASHDALVSTRRAGLAGVQSRLEHDADAQSQTVSTSSRSADQLLGSLNATCKDAAQLHAQSTQSFFGLFAGGEDVVDEAEDQFTKVLTEYSRKQFQDGLISGTLNDDPAHYAYVDITSPGSELVRGRDERARVEDRAELLRLQQLERLTETEATDVIVQLAVVEACAASVKQSAAALAQKRFAESDTESLRFGI